MYYSLHDWMLQQILRIVLMTYHHLHYDDNIHYLNHKMYHPNTQRGCHIMSCYIVILNIHDETQ